MDQCSGDMKYALKTVEENLNNLCRSCQFPIVTVNTVVFPWSV